MRPIYFLLKIALAYAFALFFRRKAVINSPKRLFGRTIFVSNHANSFMDPIIIASSSWPIVHFMTRSDVFKWWLKPILWSAHMLPIYRQHDGGNTQSKNDKVFNKVNKALKLGRNILIFSEGFTDDKPIYGLKPIKKGAIRMGFIALEECKWEKEIYIQALGVNYANRNAVGSEVLIEYQDKICLNDYKEAYAENANKAITDLTRKIELLMQASVLYLEDVSNTDFMRNIMSLKGNAYHPTQTDSSIPLVQRYQNAKVIAKQINENTNKEAFQEFKKEVQNYSSLLKRMKLSDEYVALAAENKLTRQKEFLQLLLLLPFALIGWLTCFIPYFAAKNFAEKIMKRDVFWGSVKLMLGIVFGLLFLLPICIISANLVGFSAWWGCLVFMVLPLFWRLSYSFQKVFVRFQTIGKIQKVDLAKFIQKRTEILANLEVKLK